METDIKKRQLIEYSNNNLPVTYFYFWATHNLPDEEMEFLLTLQRIDTPKLMYSVFSKWSYRIKNPAEKERLRCIITKWKNVDLRQTISECDSTFFGGRAVKRILKEYKNRHVVQQIKELEKGCSPNELAVKIFNDPNLKGLTDIPLKKETLNELNKLKFEERAKEDLIRKENAIKDEISAYKATHSPEQFAVKYNQKTSWRKFVSLSEKEKEIVALAKIQIANSMTVQRVAVLLKLSEKQVLLWHRWGWLKHSLASPKQLDGTQLPNSKKVKLLQKKQLLMPPSAFVTGYWIQKDIIDRGWRKQEIDEWLGSPDEIKRLKYDITIYRFSKERVMKCEEERERILQRFKDETRKLGEVIPDSFIKIEDAMQFAINKLPHLHKITCKKTVGGWKISKQYKVGEISLTRNATISCSTKITTWKELRQLAVEIKRKQKEKFAQWDIEYKDIKKIVSEYMNSGLLPEILSQGLKEIKSDDWISPNLKMLLHEAITRATISHTLELSKFHNTFKRPAVREIVAILGPTNSGKTFEAFQHLSKAQNGVYLAPLRLMASEGWDKLNELGCACSLLTGEEQRMRHDATHISATVEMLPVQGQFEVAVIDEIQMLADPDRGWAWTNAFFGVNAKTVYLIGALQSQALIEQMVKLTKEKLTIVCKTRFTPLTVIPAIKSIKNAPVSSALVSFSRKEVLRTKEMLGDNCSVVYGALSPEVRREEARRFMNKETPRLATTDAIGMGLNLPIQTLIFTQLRKWDGNEVRDLTATEVQQIAGRAGRFGMFEEAHVTTVDPNDLTSLNKKLFEQIPRLPLKMQIAPHLYMLKLISQNTGYKKLYNLLLVFQEIPLPNKLYYKANLQNMLHLARILERAGSTLGLTDQFNLCACPINIRSETQINHWKQWADFVVKQKPCYLQDIAAQVTFTQSSLSIAEEAVAVRTSYKWLHFRFPTLFPGIEEADRQITALNDQILKVLKGKIKKTCIACGKHITHKHALCEDCYGVSISQNL